MKGCPECEQRVELYRQWTTNAIASIRRVLECHALGAEVIALKDPKYERLNALHALDQLHRIESALVDARLAQPIPDPREAVADA
jgi:hypothetical protein